MSLMTKKNSFNRRKVIRKTFGWLLFLIVVSAGSLYLYLTLNGYRIHQDFTLERGGSVRLLLPEPGIDVYLDQSRKGRSSSADELFPIPHVKTGEHTVIVSHTDYWPWNKKITVASDELIQLFPFITPKNSSGLMITKEDPEYEKILSLINEEVYRGTAEKTSRDGNVRARIEGNTLSASWLGLSGTEPLGFCRGEECGGETFILNPEREIRIFNFYRGRSNVFIVAVGDGIYLIDAGEPGNQNFHPLYSGKTPTFAFSEKNTLFVKDGELLFEIKL